MTRHVLRCDETGPGSRAEIVEYVRTVLEHNTVFDQARNPTGSLEKLAHGMVYSILHRLGIEQVMDDETGTWG